MNNVINLSNKAFTIYEFKLLHKNLNFCPTPNRYNKTQSRNDINAFIRKIKLQAYFKNTEQNLDYGQFRVSHNNKTWTSKKITILWKHSHKHSKMI